MRVIALVGWISFIFLALSNIGLTDLSGSYQARLSLAKLFEKAAKDCLSDVTEKNITYSASKECGSLGSLSLAYGAASGTTPENNLPHLIYLDGLSVVWMAIAFSNAQYGTKVISSW